MKIYKILTLLSFIALVAIITSPFIWIWVGWSLFWKILLTGLLSLAITGGTTKVIKDIEKELILKESENED